VSAVADVGACTLSAAEVDVAANMAACCGATSGEYDIGAIAYRGFTELQRYVTAAAKISVAGAETDRARWPRTRSAGARHEITRRGVGVRSSRR
jgi:hypothetical protein